MRALVHSERRLVRHSVPHIFRVVADVGEYKRFVPWCVDSVVTYKRPGGRYIEADLSVGFAMFNEKYTSRVELARNERIIARAKDTVLFTRLVNEWKFERGPDEESTWLSFHVDFEFKNALYAQASKLFFDEIVHKMVTAFEKRAREQEGAYNDLPELVDAEVIETNEKETIQASGLRLQRLENNTNTTIQQHQNKQLNRRVIAVGNKFWS
jgi:ribosome-associated toxin RatA of RatAB toxin-antitoxin module